jgi:hypothetical protein
MPYIVSFVKSLELSGRQTYTNDCCVGGDIVFEQLLPALAQRYGPLQAHQEDWGWFAWFAHGGYKLAVDVHADDELRGEFQVHLTSRKPRLLLGAKTEDSRELELLRDMILETLRAWPVSDLKVERVNAKYYPL